MTQPPPMSPDDIQHDAVRQHNLRAAAENTANEHRFADPRDAGARFPFNGRWTRRQWAHASLVATMVALLGTIVPGFATVLPQLESSVAAMYVNLDAVEDQYLDEVPAEYREFVKALQSVGMTAQPAKDGEQHSVLRLSVN